MGKSNSYFAFGWMHDEGSGSETLGLRRFSSLANQKAACHRAKNPPKIGNQFVGTGNKLAKVVLATGSWLLATGYWAKSLHWHRGTGEK